MHLRSSQRVCETRGREGNIWDNIQVGGLSYRASRPQWCPYPTLRRLQPGLDGRATDPKHGRARNHGCLLSKANPSVQVAGLFSVQWGVSDGCRQGGSLIKLGFQTDLFGCHMKGGSEEESRTESPRGKQPGKGHIKADRKSLQELYFWILAPLYHLLPQSPGLCSSSKMIPLL